MPTIGRGSRNKLRQNASGKDSRGERELRKAIAEREASNDTQIRKSRDKSYDPYVEKFNKWVGRSSGKVRADVVHGKLLAMGYKGSERRTRRIVNISKASYNHDNHRVYKARIPEPGMWC